jgi:hypothetical protein
MLDVSILILIFIFGLYAGFISKYNIAHHLTIKIIMIIGIIILQFIRDKYANIYTIVLGTMLVIPYSSKLKEYFEIKDETTKDEGNKQELPKKNKGGKKVKDDNEDKTKKDKGNKKELTKKNKGGKKVKDDDEDDENGEDGEDDEDSKDDKKPGGLFGKKKIERKPVISEIPQKCVNQKIKILIPDNINVETEKMMSCKTMTDICFQMLDPTKQNDMCSSMPEKSFSSSAKVDPLPANKRDQLTADNCVHYLSQCARNKDPIYPGKSLCKNLSTSASAGSGDAI